MTKKRPMGRFERMGKTSSVRSQCMRGFTLVELMIVVTIVAVLLTLAVPSFRDATLSSKLSSYANNFVASARLARGEALKRNAVVTLCVSNATGDECATGGWEQGWIVMCLTSDGVVCDASGTDSLVFHHQQALPAGFKFIASGSFNSTLGFQPTGVGVTGALNNSKLTVCRATPTAGKQQREIKVSITGKTSVAPTEDASYPCS